MADDRVKFDGFQAVAEMLRHMNREEAEKLLTGIAAQDPKLFERLKDQLFIFDDLIHVNPKGIQALVGGVKQDRLVLALRKSSPELKNHILSSLSKRASEDLREALEAQTPQPMSQVLEAQAEVVKKVKQLEGEGKIVVMKNGEPR